MSLPLIKKSKTGELQQNSKLLTSAKGKEKMLKMPCALKI